ncbi:MAG: segregation/condensation protein A [Pelagibacteraceae bacterium TMED216]|nr:MAG: segregation/condensation protein A [Pelagibacteraceae bacterium TMED216]|tara:strand:+ start:2584 stop:3321 length:738 start_codon:yes stop_codon:yes gene_type:complete
MESIKNKTLSLDIPNFTGPLELLLDLAKSQKVNLNEISITLLADQFLNFIKNSENLNLESASEYLLMATWLAYLKSKLLLPEEDDEDFKALEIAEKLKLQLKKLELIRLLSDQLLNKKRVGKDLFYRGMKGGIKSINTPVYDISLYELLKTYANMNMQKAFKTINIPKLPVFTTEEGIKHINKNLEKLNSWQNLNNLIPKYYKNNKMFKTGSAGLLAACLELTKEGILSIEQKKMFDEILIKKSN